MANPLRKRTRRLFVVIAAVTVVGMLWWSWPRPVALEVIGVERGLVRSTIVDLGETRVREPYAITAPATGQLRRITLEPGDRVEAGEVVAWVDPSRSTPLDARTRATLAAALQQAEAARNRARAEASQAADEARRSAAMWEQRLVAEQVFQAAQARARAAGAALAEANAGVARIQAELGDAEGGGTAIAVPSPIAGTVLARNAESARPVAAGEHLMDIGDPETLEVIAEFLSQEAALIRPGASAWIEGWGGAAVPAVVRKVSPGGRRKVSALGVEEQRVDVWLDPGEPLPGVGHGYQVEARIETALETAALRVPVESLVRTGETWMAWVVVDGRLEAREVVPGISDGVWRAMDGGLSEGELVVRHPAPALQAGMRVEPRSAE